MGTTPTPTTPADAPAAAAPAEPAAPAFDDAALAAELDALNAPAAPAAPDAAGEAPAADSTEGEGGDPADPEATEDDASAAEPAAEAAEDDAAAEEDPELAKRLEAIQRAEKRSRDALAAERREFEAERQRLEAELAPQRELLQRYQEAAQRAKIDPAGVLRSLGLGPDDFEAVAREVYAHSSAAAKDPALRDQAARNVRERDALAAIEQVKQENAKLRAEIERDRNQRQVDEYVASVHEAARASEATPLVRSLVTNDPTGARAEFARVAQQLLQQTGEVPDPGDVVAALEQSERTRLERYGIPYPAAGKAAPKTPPPVAGETRGKTITNELANSPTPPRTEPLTGEELDADILRGLQSL